MKNIEDLFKVSIGAFDTPKKQNRCDKTVAPELVEQLEAGAFTHEMLTALVDQHPVFRYRTCVTIHGAWPEVARQRIGSYKNIIQNANGSIEVRYSAIDRLKRKEIAELTTQYGFSYWDTSGGGYFQSHTVINKDNYAAVLAEYREAKERIEKVNFYGHVSVFRAQDWTRQFLVLHVSALAIPEASVPALAVAMAGQGIGTLRAKVEERRKEQQENERERKAESEERRIKLEADHAIRAVHQAELYRAIAHCKSTKDMTEGTLVAVVPSTNQQKCMFKFYRFDGKGGFGRIKYSTAVSSELDTDAVKWTQQKETKPADIRISYPTHLWQSK